MARSAYVLKDLRPALRPAISGRRFRFAHLALSTVLFMSAFQSVLHAEEQPTPVLQLQQGTVDDTKKTPDVLNGNIEKTDVIDGNPTGEEGTLSRRQSSLPPASENDQGPLFGATQKSPYRAVIINQS